MLQNRDNSKRGNDRASWKPTGQGRTRRGRAGDSRGENGNSQAFQPIGSHSLNVLFDLEFIFISWILFIIYAALAVSPRVAWGFLILIFLYLGLLQIVA